MGREIREIPLSWQHPKDSNGQYVPHHCCTQDPDDRAAYIDDDGVDTWNPDWSAYYLDEPWPEGTPMGFALYENVTEGTPLTPTFATRAEVADYLATHGDFWGNHWSRAAADGIARSGYAPSLVIIGNAAIKPNDAAMYAQET